MNGRWGISIDVEGFSKNYEHSENRKTFAILALAELMDSIVKIGRLCFPGKSEINFSDRLFVHQFGDGFIICSDYPESDATRAISIAVTLMRHMILKGFATKAAISSGDMSDIKGCYPNSVRDTEDERVDLGMGIMTVISVMGTALTKSHKLAGTHSGAVLIIDDNLVDLGLPNGSIIQSGQGNCIDWANSNLPMVEDIARKAGLFIGTPARIIEKLNAYCTIEPIPPKSWIDATFSTLNAGMA
jgi:hypothetical protein